MCTTDINAQVSDTTRITIEDGWIEKMSGKFSMDLSFNNSYNTFEVVTPTNKIILYPNTPNNLRLSINYRFISFGVNIAPDFLPGNGDEKTKGKTNSFELGTALIFKHWFTEISYSRVKGYYLENTRDYTSWEEGDLYFQFPNLYYKGFTLSSGYIHNSRFSLRSIRSQTERQLKSAGSFIPIFNFRYYVTDNKDPGPSSQKTNNIETVIGPGYAHTFVTKEKYYFSMGLYSAFGYLNTKLTTRQSSGNNITKQDNFIFRWIGKIGIGYNSSRFYTGLFTDFSGASYEQENTTAINNELRIVYHLFFGLRLNSPRFLKQEIDKIDDLL